MLAWAAVATPEAREMIFKAVRSAISMQLEGSSCMDVANKCDAREVHWA